MLSRTGLYALRAVVVLVGVPDRWVSAADLAETLSVPKNYLSKTLHRLAGAGVLESRRGRGGGFRLTAPEKLSVEDVVDVFDHVRIGPQCIMRPRLCDPEDPCPAHQEWSGWLESRRESRQGTRIADLIGPAPTPHEALRPPSPQR